VIFYVFINSKVTPLIIQLTIIHFLLLKHFQWLVAALSAAKTAPKAALLYFGGCQGSGDAGMKGHGDTGMWGSGDPATQAAGCMWLPPPHVPTGNGDNTPFTALITGWLEADLCL